MAAEELPIEIDCRSVRDRLATGDDLVLVDCREAEEHAVARIEGSVLVPMSQLAARAGELEPYRDREIAVHCHHGGRSLRVVNWLRQQGYSRARNMTGGIDQWSQEIDPSVPRY